MSPEEIMQRVEIAQRRLQATHSPSSDGLLPIGETPAQGERSVQAPAPPPVPGKASYGLDELCRHDGADFVDNAFACLVGRAPGDEGVQFVGMLLRGETKPYVLGEILVHTRARPLSAVAGLRRRYLVQRVYHLPLVGHLLAVAGSLARLPQALRYQRMVQQQWSVLRSRDMAELAALERARADSLAVLRRDGEQRHAALEMRVDSSEATVRARLDAVAMRTEEIASAQGQRVGALEQRTSAVEGELRERLGVRPAGATLEEAAPDQLAVARAKSGAMGFQTAGHDPEDVRYHLFEAAFYNSDFVRVKQRIYLPYIDRVLAAKYPVLDFGCGRGEFLEILRNEGIRAVGIDLSALNARHLAARGFEVHGGDGLEFLAASARQYSAIVAFQVVEHLPAGGLQRLIELAARHLVPGGTLILETVNPHAPFALANFYMDETHVAPIPPDRLAFQVQYAGFVDVRVVYSTPVPPFALAGAESRSHYNDFAVVAALPRPAPESIVGAA